MFVGRNLETWRRNKQFVVSRSSAEAQFWAATQGIGELLLSKKLVEELGLKIKAPIKLLCDNKAAIIISHDVVQHDSINMLK